VRGLECNTCSSLLLFVLRSAEVCYNMWVSYRNDVIDAVLTRWIFFRRLDSEGEDPWGGAYFDALKYPVAAPVFLSIHLNRLRDHGIQCEPYRNKDSNLYRRSVAK
jgi:hypothetical protein